MSLTGGTNVAFGDIDNTGSMVVVSGGAVAAFYDDVTQNGVLRVSKSGSTTSVAVSGDFSGAGGSTGGGDIFFEGDLRPGNSPPTVTFDNNVSLGSMRRAGSRVGGPLPGTQFDRVNIAGELCPLAP